MQKTVKIAKKMRIIRCGTRPLLRQYGVELNVQMPLLILSVKDLISISAHNLLLVVIWLVRMRLSRRELIHGRWYASLPGQHEFLRMRFAADLLVLHVIQWSISTFVHIIVRRRPSQQPT